MYNADIDKNTQKLGIVMFYKSTKGGTDTFNLLYSNYTTARVSLIGGR